MNEHSSGTRAEVPPSITASGADNPIVGHKTMKDGTHLPLHKIEADSIMAAVEAAQAKRIADMPDEQAALRTLTDAHQRLSELGWRSAIYCPKDGSAFHVIEAGSSGIHTAHYEGEWPKGGWWIHDDGDMWPSRPILYKAIPPAPALGTDSAPSAKEINPDVADQGSVRNATDELADWKQIASEWKYRAEAAEAKLRALPDQKD